jgi:hypothetical protein
MKKFDSDSHDKSSRGASNNSIGHNSYNFN